MENDYLYDLEEIWRKDQNKRDFGREIIETMPYFELNELLEQCLEIHINKKEELAKRYKTILCRIRKHFALGTFEYEFNVNAIWLLKGMTEDIKNENQLDTLVRYWYFNESRNPLLVNKNSYKPTMPDFSILIQKAKQVPIASLLKIQLRHSGHGRLTCLCPFHTERTPSFTIYTKTNTFCCFGCDQKGDVITFYQKLYGVNFIEAVRALTGN